MTGQVRQPVALIDILSTPLPSETGITAVTAVAAPGVYASTDIQLVMHLQTHSFNASTDTQLVMHI